MTREEFDRYCQNAFTLAGIRNFKPYEVARKNRKSPAGVTLQVPQLKHMGYIIAVAHVLEWVRSQGQHRPITCNSWYRDLLYNRSLVDSEGNRLSKDTSQHVVGGAVDFTQVDLSPRQVATRLLTHPNADLLGIGLYARFVHVDVRGLVQGSVSARWEGPGVDPSWRKDSGS